MAKVRIAINGFGRIGRMALRAGFDNEDIEFVAVNDLADIENLAYLLQHDTVYGQLQHDVAVEDGVLRVGKHELAVYSEKSPSDLPWKQHDVDVVLECTGVFRTTEQAHGHIDAGAQRVIISAPPKDTETQMFVTGANEDQLGAEHTISSNASCTTNCIAPVVAVLHEAIGVEKAMMTTVHAYTAGQGLVDGPNKDMRRGRAAALNIVPTTTGAAKATGKVIDGLPAFDGISIRVPVPVGSLSDITMLVGKDTTTDEVNALLQKAAQTDRYKNVLLFSEDELVSSDIVGTTYSSIVDSKMTRVVGGNLVKVVAWYDNELAYAHRLVEQAVALKPFFDAQS